MKLRDFDGALEDCNEAMELCPNNPKAYFRRGQAHHGKMNYEQSLVSAGFLGPRLILPLRFLAVGGLLRGLACLFGPRRIWTWGTIMEQANSMEPRLTQFFFQYDLYTALKLSPNDRGKFLTSLAGGMGWPQMAVHARNKSCFLAIKNEIAAVEGEMQVYKKVPSRRNSEETPMQMQ